MSIDITFAVPPKKNMTDEEFIEWFFEEQDQDEDWLESVQSSAPQIRDFYRDLIQKCPPINDSDHPLSDDDSEEPNVIDYSFSKNYCQLSIHSEFPDDLFTFIEATATKHGLRLVAQD